jgi:hypothetical protein
VRWVLIVTGGVLVLLPGMLNPYAPVNGATLLGLILLVWAALRMIREDENF